jgi:hypothetical protein
MPAIVETESLQVIRQHLIFVFYQNGGKLAVELVGENGEPIAMLSVNIPESSHMLGENEFFAKTWSENEEIAEDALQSGIFRDTGRTSDGFLKAGIWTFS